MQALRSWWCARQRRVGAHSRRKLLQMFFHLLAISFGAFRANSMRELGVGAIPDVNLDLCPVAMVVTDLLAVGADREQAAQQLHLGEGCLQLAKQCLTLFL